MSSPSPGPEAKESLPLSLFCPQGPSVPGYVPLIPALASASWLHPRPDQTPAAPPLHFITSQCQAHDTQ